MRIISVFIFCFLIYNSAFSATESDEMLSTPISGPLNYIEQPFDVLHYDAVIDLTKAPSKEMTGVCNITLYWKEKPDTNLFYFHLRGLNVDSAFYDGTRVTVVEKETPSSPTYHYEITPPAGDEKDTVVVTIYYHGTMTAEPGQSVWGGVQTINNILFAMGVGFYNNYVSATQHWLPCYDLPSDKATFHCRFIVDSGMAVASNGSFQFNKQKNGTYYYEYWHNYPCATYLYTFAVSNYILVDLSFGITPVVIFSLPQDTMAVKFVFRLLPRTIQAFEKRFGKYPFERVGYVMTPIGSMEHETMISYDIHALRDNYNARDTLNIVGAHELSHQWFGDLVTCRDFRDAWLNEGFATFCEAIWIEDLFGWNSYLDYLSSKEEYYLGTLAPFEGVLPLYDYPRNYPSSNYPGTIYNKGAAVLGMLRYELGDSLFFKGVNDYLSGCAFGDATTDTLKYFIEKASNKNLDWFFEQWVKRSGWPILKIREYISSNGIDSLYTLKLHIQQSQSGEIYVQVPLEVKLEFENDSVIYKMLRIDSLVEDFVIASLPKIKSISYNNGPSVRTLVELHSEPVSVNDITENPACVFAYPNPANDFIRLLFNEPTGNTKLRLINSLGQEVYSENANITNSGQFYGMHLAGIPAGAYMLVIESIYYCDSINIIIQH